MRILAGIMLIVSAVLFLLLGTLYVISSKFEEEKAQTAAGDLSSVSKDLTNEEEITQMHQAVKEKTKYAGARTLSMGVVSLALGLLQIVAGALIILRRAKIFSLIISGVSMVAIIGLIIFDGHSALKLIILGMLFLTALIHWFFNPSTRTSSS
jgi:hypothetical protein